MRNLTQQEFGAYIASLAYPPNHFQQAILEEVAFNGTSKNAQHLVIKALAGSGKTTLLVMLAELLKLMGDDGERDLFLAFNVKIADELNKRLPDGFSAINSHKVGNRAIKGRTRMNKYKMRDLCKPMIEAAFSENEYTRNQRYVLTRTLEDLVSKTMLNLLDPTDTEAVMGMALHHGMFEDEVFLDHEIAVMLNLLPQAMAEANKVYEQSKEISFDEMLYIPVKGGMIPRRFDRAFVDECQDLNKAQQEIVFMSVRDGGRMIFVGDPNQAIYGFAGADAFSFENLIERSEAKVLELNICYRCPSSHLDLARAIVPEIESRPGAPEGKIEYIPDEALPKHTTPGSLVMCRLTAPLIQAYFDHVKARKKAQVLGRDIGADLIKMMEKVANQKGFAYPRAVEFLDKYYTEQRRKLMQREANESQLELLKDKRDALEACIIEFNCQDMRCLKRELEELFGTGYNKEAKQKEEDVREAMREEMVTLCTVHRAKGLEAHTTFILRPDKMPLEWSGQKAWEKAQEQNILYVALTRSTDTMYIVGDGFNVRPVKHGETPTQPVAAQEEPIAVDALDFIAEMGALASQPLPPLTVDTTETDDSIDNLSPEEMDMAGEMGQMPRTDWDRADFGETWGVDMDQLLRPGNPTHGFEDEPSTASIDDATIAEVGVVPLDDDAQEAQIIPDDAAPEACPFCDGEGEVTENGTPWVCGECDGTGNAAPDIDTPNEDEPETRTLEKHEVEHHLRQLPAGKKPTRRAYALAKKFGVDLNDHPGKTFVLPHERTNGETQPSLPGIHEFDQQLFSEPAPDNRPQQVELGMSDSVPISPSPVLSRLAVDTALKTLDDTRPGATLATKLMAFDTETIDTLIDVLTHIKTLKAERAEQSA